MLGHGARLSGGGGYIICELLRFGCLHRLALHCYLAIQLPLGLAESTRR